MVTLMFRKQNSRKGVRSMSDLIVILTLFNYNLNDLFGKVETETIRIFLDIEMRKLSCDRFIIHT